MAPVMDSFFSPAIVNGQDGSSLLNDHNNVMDSLNGDSEFGLLSTPLSPTTTFDVIVAGFGPSSLAFAIAISDFLESSNGNNLFQHPGIPRIAFLEKQKQFGWHEGMLIKDTRMQISFIKDMATLRNPRSRFTFLNYLWEKNRIVQFANLNTFLPTRLEFEDYLQWCAEKFENNVHYGNKVIDITPHLDGDVVNHFSVKSLNVITNEEIILKARHVIVGVGATPNISPPFQHLYYDSHINGQFGSNKPTIIHSSQYMHVFPPSIAGKQNSLSYARRIAVIGSGQSAAEIFTDLATRLSNENKGSTELHLLFRCSSLKPADDSPFVNEVFDPVRIEPFYKAPTNSRREHINEHRNTNYGVVREELLEKMYELLYMQKVEDESIKTVKGESGHSGSALRLRILPGADVQKANFREKGTISLDIKWIPIAGLGDSVMNGDTQRENEGFEYDIVILATGYSHASIRDILLPVCEAATSPSSSATNHDSHDSNSWAVGQDYRISVKGLQISRHAGIWLQGCNEGTHGLSDTLLSGLAIRGGQLVQSIFNVPQSPTNSDGTN